MDIKRRRLETFERERAAALREFSDFDELLADATPDERARLGFQSPPDNFNSNIQPSGAAGSSAANFLGAPSSISFANSLVGSSNPSNLLGSRTDTNFYGSQQQPRAEGFRYPRGTPKTPAMDFSSEPVSASVGGSSAGSSNSSNSAGSGSNSFFDQQPRPQAEVFFEIGRSMAGHVASSQPVAGHVATSQQMAGHVAMAQQFSGHVATSQQEGGAGGSGHAVGGYAARRGGDPAFSGESPPNVASQLQDRRRRFVDVDGREYAVHNVGADMYRHSEFSLFFRRMSAPSWLSRIMLGEGLELQPERVRQALSIRSRGAIMRSGVHGAIPPSATAPATSRSSRLGAFDSIRLLPVFSNQDLFVSFLTGRWGMAQGFVNLSHFSEGGRVSQRHGSDFSHSDIANAIQNFNLGQIACFGEHWEGVMGTLEGHLRFESTWRSQRPQFILWRIEAELEDFHFVGSAKYDNSDLGPSCPESLSTYADMISLFGYFLANIAPDVTSENYFRRSFDLKERGTYLSLHGGPLKGGRDPDTAKDTTSPHPRKHDHRSVSFADDASTVSGSSRESATSEGPPSPLRKQTKGKDKGRRSRRAVVRRRGPSRSQGRTDTAWCHWATLWG